MSRLLGFAASGAALFFTVAASAAAQNAPLNPPPPGAILQRQRVSLQGKRADGGFLAVISRIQLRASSGRRPATYQPYLTLYRKQTNTFVQIYRSPGPNDTLRIVASVRRIPGPAPIFIPFATVRIDGAGALMGPGRQQLVVSTYETGADCGTTILHVLAYDATTSHVSDAVRVLNPCNLAGVVRRDAVELTGPYYSRTAPLCCPTKPHARATLRYARGKWVERPSYFTLLPAGRFVTGTANGRAAYDDVPLERNPPSAPRTRGAP